MNTENQTTPHEPSDEVAALQRQIAELQASREGLEATLETIEANSNRFKAPDAAPAPAVSLAAFEKRKATTLEGIEADAMAEQEQLAKEIRELSIVGGKIKREEGEVEAALTAAENRLRVLSSPNRQGYVGARAELAAKALMGEAVDLDAVPAHDTAESMSVADVQGGILALKKRRDVLANEFRKNKSAYIQTSLEFCRLYGVAQACRMIAAKRQLREALCGLMAAEDKTLRFLGNNPIIRAGASFMPLHFEHQFSIPAINDMDSLKELKALEGKDLSPIDCDRLRSTNAVNAAVNQLDAAMLGGAA